MRIFGWSDLHVDFAANRKLVEQLSRQDYQQDLLLLAGDVSNQLARLTQTLRSLKDRFAEVAFVPGNHDLWIARGDHFDSLGKLQAMRAQIRDLGIQLDSFTRVANGRLVRFIPLLAWYLKPEEGAGSLFLAKPGEDPDLHMWADNYRIRWPALPNGRSPAEHLLALNAGGPHGPASPPAQAAPVTVTFSHFLPRVELVFGDWEKFQADGTASGHDRAPEFNFTRVAGCRQLDELLRSHRSTLHLYGHQHRNRDRRIDGVRYLSHCLGYPTEPLEPDATPRHLPLEIKLNA